MYIFRLDDSQATIKTVKVIGEVHFRGDATSRPFTKQGRACFADMSVQEIEASFWLGHADSTMMGDYTASEFVSKFTAEFTAQFQRSEREKVRHLYLLGCETGLIEHGTSLAQQIADGLERGGFKNVVVHAIANPPLPDRAMIIKVVETPSFGNRLMGEVHGMLLTKAQAARFGELQGELARQEGLRKTESVRRTIDGLMAAISQIEEQAVMFLNTVDIRMELDRPSNCFVPNHPERRPVKILAQEVALIKIEEMLKQLALSEACKNKLEQAVGKAICLVQQHAKDEMSILKKLKKDIAQHAGPDWWREVEVAKKMLRQQTNSYRMLDAISVEARETTTSFVAAPRLFSPQAVGPVSHSVRHFFSLAAERLQPKPAMPVAMHTAIMAMTAHATQLDCEYRKSWLGQEIKLYKARILRQIVTQIETDFDKNPQTFDWLSVIKSALDDSKLTQGMISHRTFDLLQGILAQNQSNERTAVLVR